VSALVLLFGVAVLVRGRRIAASRLFFVMTACAAGWLGAWAAMYAAGEAATALAWGRVGYFFAVLIPSAVFHFATEFAGRRKEHRPSILIFWIACAAVGVLGLTSDVLLAGVRRFPWGYYIAGRAVGAFVLIGFSAILITSVHLLWRAYRTAEGKARERAATLILGLILGLLGLFDYLPSIGIDLQPVGAMATLAFVVVSATAVWRFELADITPEFAAGQILETMKGAVFVADMSGTIRVVNRAALTLLGYEDKDLRGAHVRSILPPTQNLTTGQLLNSMGVLENLMKWRTADGLMIDVLASSSFLRDDTGMPVAVVYVASDYTERKKAEQALRESENRHRMLFEMNPLPMWVYDLETLQFTAVNDATLQHYGYTRDEFLRMTLKDIRPIEEIPRMIDALQNLEEKRGPSLFRHRKKDGTVFDVEVRSFEFVSGRRRARLAIAQDITDRKRAEEEVRKSEERYRELFENANDLIYTHDLEGRITSMNVACERLTGYKREEVLGRVISDFVVPEHRERGQEALARKIRGEAAHTFYELDLLSRGGERVPVEVNTRLIYENGRPAGVQGIGRDISERRESEARFRLLFERNLAGVYRTTTDGRILDCNEACARIFGYGSPAELLGSDAADFYFDDRERDRVVQMLGDQRSISNLELRLRRRDGTAIWVLENVTLLESGVMEGTIIDITDRKLAQEQMEYQAYHDALTALPNRLLFRDRITVAQAHARRHGTGLAVMFLDLDQFKLVNDTLGHTVGDRLLQVIAERLVNCVRAQDTVGRMGGDEFTILLTDLHDRRGASGVAQKILDAVRNPVRVDEHELFVTTSIGIAVGPDDGDDAETLLKNADRAMYRAKEVGRDNYQYATPAWLDGTDARLALERDLRHALDRNELVVHYQPMIEIATGRVVGAEALVRWNHPENGLMPPEDFIRVAEETHLIVPLGAWVLRAACAQMKAWHDAGHAWLRVAVNLSPRQFQDRALIGTVERVLAETGFPAPYLDLEITESTAMHNAELSLAILKRLKEMGIRISIDDFGTGYSSLSYLKRFPIDTVKIDQDFVRDLTSGDEAIITAVISMARALNLRVIAEGVETEAQLDFLRREKCAEMQGFLYSQPLPAAEFERALRGNDRAVTERAASNRLRLTVE
jgi:diguanylate cyclase (GGDEF)-like protein/PAS domain S-box-containing protein